MRFVGDPDDGRGRIPFKANRILVFADVDMFRYVLENPICADAIAYPTGRNRNVVVGACRGEQFGGRSDVGPNVQVGVDVDDRGLLPAGGRRVHRSRVGRAQNALALSNHAFVVGYVTATMGCTVGNQVAGEVRVAMVVIESTLERRPGKARIALLVIGVGESSAPAPRAGPRCALRPPVRMGRPPPGTSYPRHRPTILDVQWHSGRH